MLLPALLLRWLLLPLPTSASRSTDDGLMILKGRYWDSHELTACMWGERLVGAVRGEHTSDPEGIHPQHTHQNTHLFVEHVAGV